MKSPYPVDPFDRSADDYDRKVAAPRGFPMEGYAQVLDEIVRRASARAGMYILDLGVGTGNLALRFAHLGCQVAGLDFSARMLERARDKLPSAVLAQADLLDEWPASLERRYDRVVSSYALHHLDLAAKRELIVRLFRCYLAPDGLVLVGDISFASAAARQGACVSLEGAWEDDEHYWAADETEATLAQDGLTAHYHQVSAYGGVYVLGRGAYPPFVVRP